MRTCSNAILIRKLFTISLAMIGNCEFNFCRLIIYAEIRDFTKLQVSGLIQSSLPGEYYLNYRGQQLYNELRGAIGGKPREK